MTIDSAAAVERAQSRVLGERNFRWVWAAIIGTFALDAVGYLLTTEPDHPKLWTDVPWFIGFIVVAGAIGLGLVHWGSRPAPDHNRPARVGLVALVPFVLSLVVFWAALPVITGAALATLGTAGVKRAREEAGLGWLARALQVVGIVAIAAMLVMFLFYTITEFDPSLPS